MTDAPKRRPCALVLREMAAGGDGYFAQNDIKRLHRAADELDALTCAIEAQAQAARDDALREACKVATTAMYGSEINLTAGELCEAIEALIGTPAPAPDFVRVFEEGLEESLDLAEWVYEVERDNMSKALNPLYDPKPRENLPMPPMVGRPAPTPAERHAAYRDYCYEITENGNERLTNIVMCNSGNDKKGQHIAAQVDLAFKAGWSAALRAIAEGEPTSTAKG